MELPYHSATSFVDTTQRTGSAAAAGSHHFQGTRYTEWRASLKNLADVETVEVHHLGPGLDKVPGELLLAVRGGVNFCHSAQFGA
jgi:hypothetical protein